MESQRVALSNADDAYQAIRRLILTVQMPPGSNFTEQELVRRVGLGKTPVREALLRLRLERLVEVQARQGYRVAPVTLKDVRDSCRLLGYLEAAASHHAAADPSVPQRLEPVLTQVEQAVPNQQDGAPRDGWIRADLQFHVALARGQDNRQQAEVMTQLSQAVLRYRHLALVLGAPPDLLTHAHGSLTDALKGRRPDAAAAAASELWRTTETGLVSVLGATESVLSTNVWSTRDRNAFYLDAVAPAPAVDEIFPSRRSLTERNASRTAEPS